MKTAIGITDITPQAVANELAKILADETVLPIKKTNHASIKHLSTTKSAGSESGS